ncbi:MAG TPA: hypothetical protein VJV23_05830 [Candidatus Polarisedimenticolia bacterium]|nr:hypothetical protein [Candidatus Polarisedimenticolia bacterium]
MRSRIVRSLAAILSAAAGVAHASASMVKPPVRLGQAVCDLPEQFDSVTGHVLVQYRVAETGRVDQARAVYTVVEPQPASRAYAEALERCVRAWRYQPAMARGLPVAERLLAAFHRFEPAGAGAPAVSLPGNRSIPSAHLERLRREKQVLAMSLLSGRDFTETEGPDWVVRTNAPRGQLEAVLSSIRSAAAAFEAAFGAAASPPVAGERLTIMVFRRQEEFNRVVAFDELAAVHVPLAGQYAPDGQLVYLSAGGKPPRVTGRVVAHEVAHHLVHDRLYPKRRPPFWVSEGIAAFVENVALTGPGPADIDLAKLERGPQHEEGYSWISDPDRYLEAIEDASQAEHLPAVADLLAGRGAETLDRTLVYGMSWLLVHYLVNAEGGAHRGHFTSWMAGADGSGDGLALLRALRQTGSSLDRELALYARRLGQAPPAVPPPASSGR